MTKPTGKRIVSAGTETFLKKWYIEKIYDRQKEVYSKYMDKGVTMEDNSIDYISEQLGMMGCIRMMSGLIMIICMNTRCYYG